MYLVGVEIPPIWRSTFPYCRTNILVFKAKVHPHQSIDQRPGRPWMKATNKNHSKPKKKHDAQKRKRRKKIKGLRLLLSTFNLRLANHNALLKSSPHF